MLTESPYVESFEATNILRWHDTLDPFYRWFRTHTQDKFAPWPSKNEWLTIEEKEFFTTRGRRRTQWIGKIGADHHTHISTVLFEPGAPPPPTFFRPILEPYIPPKILTPAEKRKEALLAIVHRANWEIWSKANPTPTAPISTFLPPHRGRDRN